MTSEDDYNFIDDTTILHFRFQDQENYTIDMKYQYNPENDTLPSFLLIKNQNFLYLKDKNVDYYHRHNIRFDVITLP